MTLNIQALPAFSDNYIWLCVNSLQQAWVVDPGAAQPVISALDEQNLELKGIFITHHHQDHIGGVNDLLARYSGSVAVYEPSIEASFASSIKLLNDGAARAEFQVEGLGLVSVMAVAGHTAGHVMYALEQTNGASALFVGDTLFSGGCGRVFTGDYAAMHQSLKRIAGYADDSSVYAAHEYTLSNLAFGKMLEPSNQALLAYERQCFEQLDQGLPTLPTTVGLEKQVNPFLRCDVEAVKAVVARSGRSVDGELSVFTSMRQWKDQF